MSNHDNGYQHRRAPLAIGTTFTFDGAKYTIERETGHGGFGRAYVVTTPMFPTAVGPLAGKFLQRRVAKVPLTDDPDVLRRLRREASILSNLSHPHVVKLHGIATLPDGSEAIIEDFVQNALTVREYLRSVRESGGNVQEEACSLLLQALYALRELHERDSAIFHRDVSPHNVLVSVGSRHLTLIDFGLARESGGHTAGLTTKQLGGTDGCVSEEQTHDPTSIDGRSDVYAVGRTFAAALADCSPVHVWPTDEKDPVLGPLLVDMTKRRRDDRPASAATAIDRLLDGMREHGVALDPYDVHLTEWERRSTPGGFLDPDASKRTSFDRYLVARINSFADISLDLLKIFERLPETVWRDPALDAASLIDRLETSTAFASLSPYSSADALAKIYPGVFSRLDLVRKRTVFGRLCQLAVDWDRWILQGAVVEILAAEQGAIDVMALRAVLRDRDPSNVCRLPDRRI